jgi:hypothetical protein
VRRKDFPKDGNIICLEVLVTMLNNLSHFKTNKRERAGSPYRPLIPADGDAVGDVVGNSEGAMCGALWRGRYRGYAQILHSYTSMFCLRRVDSGDQCPPSPHSKCHEF